MRARLSNDHGWRQNRYDHHKGRARILTSGRVSPQVNVHSPRLCRRPGPRPAAELPVLVLTGTPHGQLAAAALAAGARAVLVKNLDRDDLVTAIRNAARDTGGRGGERLPGTRRSHR